MNKIALCLSGQTRYLDKGYSFIYENILKDNNVDVFIHTWHTGPLESEMELSFFKDENLKYSSTNIGKCINLYNPKSAQIDSILNFPEINLPGFKYSNNILSMMYSIYISNKLKKSHEDLNKSKYDCVIRARFDLAINKRINYLQEDNDSVNVLNLYKDHINDQFAFSSSENMDVYSSVFLNLLDMKNKHGIPDGYGAENYFFRNLLDSGIKLKEVENYNHPFSANNRGMGFRNSIIRPCNL